MEVVRGPGSANCDRLRKTPNSWRCAKAAASHVNKVTASTKLRKWGENYVVRDGCSSSPLGDYFGKAEHVLDKRPKLGESSYDATKQKKIQATILTHVEIK